MRIFMKRVFFLSIGCLISTPAIAVPNYWNHSYEQGYSEYQIDLPSKYGVLISCNDAASDDWDHGIALTGEGEVIESEEYEFPPIEFVINGEIYTAPDETFTRSGSEAWVKLTTALSQADTFEFYWSGENVGVFNPKNTEKISESLAACKPMIDRQMEDFQEHFSHPSQPTNTLSSDALNIRYVVENHDYGFSSTVVHVLSRENNIELQGISANRGNCPLFRGERGMSKQGLSTIPKPLQNQFEGIYGKGDVFPISLGFGQSTYFVFQNCPNLLEVEMKTNLGSGNYTF